MDSSVLIVSLVSIIIAFLSLSEGIEVDCSYYSRRNRLACRCTGPDRSTSGYEDLSSIVNRFLHERFRNIIFRHIELSQCAKANVYLDLRAFVIDDRPQNITDISFNQINDLNLIIQDIDYGSKRFVFENIGYLNIGGSLLNRQTRVAMYIRNTINGNQYINNVERRGDVVFQDFLAASHLTLINIQNQKSVTVIDSAFENLNEVDLIRTGNCFVGSEQSESVPCTKRDLFVSTAVIGATWEQIVQHPLFIGGIVFALLALLLGICACCYFCRNKKKREMELVGYPPTTPSSNVSSRQSTTKRSNLAYHVPTPILSQTPRESSRRHASTTMESKKSPQNCANYYKHSHSRTR
ncbi:uncharacterized protein [Lepeophtheirus salmonis]|uniref:uncharacterized protein n=1 Tax=Lepeophtheirus salmonis TaxID=72036 RepID=UPI001AE25BCB|nr:uncharacterized protein LOC121114051 [Lepeophtheirus salmonis]XP_040563819.1 uncharacterized protein LOC121114051 [Lepeophtheirus salmonis]